MPTVFIAFQCISKPCVLHRSFQALGEISRGDMLAADSLVEGEEHFHISEDEEEDNEEDKMSLASDLDEEERDEVEEQEMQLDMLEKQRKK